MAKMTLVDGKFTPAVDSTFVDNISAGFSAPLLKDNEALDADSAMWASIIYAGIGSVIGGYVARKRTEAGKKPIAGFLY